MKHENNNTGIDLGILLHDFLAAARRSWILAVVLALVFSAVLSIRARRSYYPQYEAKATFTVYVADPLQAEIRGYNTATAEQMAKTFPYILTSGALRDVVMRDLDIPALPVISASVMANTNVFTLSVRSGDPQQAYNVLNSVIEHYPDVAEFVVGPTVMNLLDESGLPTQPYNSLSYIGSVKTGVAGGVGLWILASLLMAVTRATVHNEDELKRLINVRCLGSVSMVKRDRRSRGKSCPMALEGSGGVRFSEAVRLLRIRLEKEMVLRDMKVLLVSSATPGEGKTTVSINLAQSLAQKGRRTLLIDCDLRNPSVAKNMGRENVNGLVDFLEGKISAEKALTKTDTPNLFVTFSGGPVENAAEMLARKESRAFLEACRELFDCIILDTPPSSMLSDASEIAVVADGALMVIRQNYASKSQITDGAQLLADSGLQLVGCTLNYTTGSPLTDYGSYYGYGSGKYYGHYNSSESEL